MTRLTRRYRFCASHRLFSKTLDEERNRKVFGKCANPFGHGHNYFLEVTVAGEPDPRSGMVLPRSAFDAWVKTSVLDRVDHTHLNSDLPEFEDLVPTAENILVVVDAWLRERWAEWFPSEPLRLAGLRLEETPRNSVQLPPSGHLSQQ